MIEEMYELFVEEWQNECVPEIDSNDFKLWLEENEKF